MRLSWIVGLQPVDSWLGNWLYCGLDSLDKVGNLSKGDTVIVNGTIGKYGNLLPLYPCSIAD